MRELLAVAESAAGLTDGVAGGAARAGSSEPDRVISPHPSDAKASAAAAATMRTRGEHVRV